MSVTNSTGRVYHWSLILTLPPRPSVGSGARGDSVSRAQHCSRLGFFSLESLVWTLWFGFWRRGRDANPRYPFGYIGFQDRLFQPLTHLSAAAVDSLAAR